MEKMLDADQSRRKHKREEGSMRDIRIGAAQFEHRNADKKYDLSIMKRLIALAVDRGADILSFHAQING